MSSWGGCSPGHRQLARSSKVPGASLYELQWLRGKAGGFERALSPTTPARSQPVGWLQNKGGAMGESGCLWASTWEKAPPCISTGESTEASAQKPPPAWELLRGPPWHPSPLGTGDAGASRDKPGGVLYLLLGWNAPSLGANAGPGGCRIPRVFTMSFVTAAPRTRTCSPQPQQHLQNPAAACGRPGRAEMRGEGRRRPRLPSQPALAPVSSLRQR